MSWWKVRNKLKNNFNWIAQKQAKHAVKCLYINTASTDESVFADVLEIVTQNLSDGVTARGESYKTAIVSLGKFCLLFIFKKFHKFF